VVKDTKKSGTLVLVLPDKRFTFDCNRPQSLNTSKLILKTTPLNTI